MTDLFAFAAQERVPMRASPASRQTLGALLPNTPVQWLRRVMAADADIPIELMVAADWTGVVVEVLSVPGEKLFLHRDGFIQTVTAEDRTYRLAFLSAAEARKIAAKVPLGLIGSPGTHGCHLRQAETAWPEIAEWLDGIEAVAEHPLKARI